MFRERPLTWLFVLATVCVDMLAIGPLPVDSLLGESLWGLYLGQVAVLGCWLVLGTRHRLERGALFVVGQVVLTTISWICLFGRRGTWGVMLAPFALYGTMAAAGVFVGKACFFRLRVTSNIKRSNMFQYSLMELIGWMVVVAIAAACLRHARLIGMLEIPELLGFFLGFSANIGVISELLVGRNRYRYAIIISIVFSLALYYLFFLKVLGVLLPPYTPAFVVSMAYVILWIVVRRLDAPSSAHTAPQIATDDQTSPPRTLGLRASVPQDLQS